MKTKHTFFITILTLLLGSSCQTKISFDADLITSKLIVNGLIQPDSVVDILIGTSKPIPGVVSDYNWISDATVILYEDDKKIEELYTYAIVYEDKDNDYNYYGSYETENKPEKGYRSKITTKAGKTYRLEISHPNYEDVSCETTIPVPIKILAYDTSTVNEDSNYRNRKMLNVSLTFQDPADEINYYRMIAYSQTGQLGLYYNNDQEDTVIYVAENYNNIDDPIINPENEDANDLLFSSPWNRYGVFTDELINGKEYTINLSIELKELRSSEFLEGQGEFFKTKFILQTISREAYLYMKSSNEHMYYDGELFVEPVQVFSNVVGGIGIFGGMSGNSFEINQGEYPIDSIEYIEDNYRYYYYW